MPRKQIAVLFARYSPRRERKGLTAAQSAKEAERKAEDLKKNSCDVQLERLREYAAAKGYVVREDLIFREDSVSGGADLGKRSQLRAAADACGRGMVFLARDIERVGRSLETFATLVRLNKQKARLETIDEGKIDIEDPYQLGSIGMKIIFGIIQRLTTKRRTKTWSRQAQADLKRVSKIPPFGYRVNGDRLEPDDREQSVVRRMITLAGSGMPILRICRTLEDECELCRGGKFYPSTVKRVLRRAGALT